MLLVGAILVLSTAQAPIFRSNSNLAVSPGFIGATVPTASPNLVTLQTPNSLTPQELQQGWFLLFDGKSLANWTNYKKTTLNSGWQIKDGTLAIVDPANGGDIVTNLFFDWFELKLEFNLGKGQNSGIMYWVTDNADATWHTGPEIQLYDATEGQLSGFLYELYQPRRQNVKPAGEWNSLRIVVSPQQCLTEMNGLTYYTYKIGSPDWNDRVAKSKFAKFPTFAKSGKGRIALQGDHGTVAFRNMKIRRLK